METFEETLEKRKQSIYKALASFQQECPVIHKATKGYGYTYSDLPTIFNIINPLLKKHGLGFTQLIQGQAIQTVLFHYETGETIESLTGIPNDVTLKGMNEFQVLGSAVTYIRRYALSSMLGIVTDKDTDAAGEQKSKTVTKTVEKKRPKFTDELMYGYIDAFKKGAHKMTKEKLIETYDMTFDQLSKIVEAK